MSGPLGSSQWMYASGAAGFYPYSIDQSLRFEEGDSPSLSRTQTSGTTTTWTFSAWVKRSRLDSVSQSGGVAGQDPIFTVGDANTNDMLIYFHQHSTADRLDIIIRDSSTIRAQLTTTRLFRDVASFYHIQVTCDFTNATQGDRLRLYVNGVRETAFDTETYPSNASQVTVVNNSSYTARIGRLRTVSSYFAGYMAEVHLVDGSALEPTSFGEFSNGVWIPISYSGSHGTAGWYLPFDDSAAIGDDESGNTNDFTATNLVASDVVLDSPTSNWFTLTPLASGSFATISEGSLKIQGNTSSNNGNFLLVPRIDSGKWYFEARVNVHGTYGYPAFMMLSDAYDNRFYHSNGGGTWPANSLIVSCTSGFSTTNLGCSNGDIVGVAIDMDSATKTVKFYKNNTLEHTQTITTGDLVIGGAVYESSSLAIYNFGQDSTFAGNETAGGNADDNGIGDFKYSPPSGFLALCTSNLPEPTIGPNSDEQADDYFNTVLWSGNSTNNRSITTDHATDWIWIKKRGTTVQSHVIADSVRGTSDSSGTGNVGILATNSTAVESTNSSDSGIASFDSTGFTIGAGSNTANADAPYQGTNASGHTYVGWSWKAGGTAVSNTDGSITSSVSAATDAGFSIVSWTGTGANATIGHGLSSAPEMIIVKNRDTSGNWHVYHKDITDAPTHVMYLNLTNANTDQPRFNDTTPTSTVFSVNDSNPMNKSGDGIIAYCFHSVSGYSAVGKYVGNGNGDGTFVWTGFNVAWVMVKRNNSGGGWHIFDNKRPNAYNVINKRLEADNTDAENSTSGCELDFVSNGFKFRGTFDNINGSGDTYIYLAFAEMPFKYANAR